MFDVMIQSKRDVSDSVKKLLNYAASEDSASNYQNWVVGVSPNIENVIDQHNLQPSDIAYCVHVSSDFTAKKVEIELKRNGFKYSSITGDSGSIVYIIKIKKPTMPASPVNG